MASSKDFEKIWESYQEVVKTKDVSIVDYCQRNGIRTLIAEYPSGMKVNALLASKCWGVREDYIIHGNGAAELIKALMELLPGTLGITRPTFEEYPNRRDKGSLVTFVPQNNEYRREFDVSLTQ